MKYLFPFLLIFSIRSFAQSDALTEVNKNIVDCTIRSYFQSDPLAEFNKFIVANWNGQYQRIGPYRVKGSLYLFGGAYPGGINYKNGKTFKDKMIYFDIYNYKIGIIEKNNRYEPTDPVEDFSILLPEQFGGKELKFRNSNAFGNSAPKGFFNILEDGKKLSLLKHFKINLMTDPVNQMDRDARVFEQVYEYYIYNKTSSELHKVKLKEKDIAKVLNDKKFMEDVIRTKKMDINNEASVITAITLYNNY